MIIHFQSVHLRVQGKFQPLNLHISKIVVTALVKVC